MKTLAIVAIALASFFLVVMPSLQHAAETLNSLSHLIGQ